MVFVVESLEEVFVVVLLVVFAVVVLVVEVVAWRLQSAPSAGLLFD